MASRGDELLESSCESAFDRGGRARRGAATEDGSGRLEAEVGVAGRSVIPAYPLGRGLPR